MIKDLINGVGALTELWAITYTNFRKAGLDDETASVHTKMFMQMMIEVALGADNNKE